MNFKRVCLYKMTTERNLLPRKKNSNIKSNLHFCCSIHSLYFQKNRKREMENIKFSSDAWWLNSHKSPQQSQWLQSTLSEFDDRTKAMLALTQEQGDPFAQKAEMYYKKRPELIKMVEDVICYEMRSQVECFNLSTSNPESVIEDPDLECFTYFSNLDFSAKNSNGFVGEQNPDRNSTKLDNDNNESSKINGLQLGNAAGKDVDQTLGLLQKDVICYEMRSQVSKLIEDNLRQQAELVRRNNEKRNAIKELCLQLDRLLEENRALHSAVRESDLIVAERKPSRTLKWKRILHGKFWR